MRVAVLIGCDPWAPVSAPRALAASDRLALALALAMPRHEIQVYALDEPSRIYARACGAKTLAQLIDYELPDFDVALVGRGGCGRRGDLAPALLAEQHGAALACEVIGLEQSPPDLIVTRDLGRGARDVLRIRGRSVLLVSDAAARTRYVSQYRLQAAGAGRDDPTLPAQAPSGAPIWEASSPRVRLGDHASRVAAGAVQRMNTLFGLGGAREASASLIQASAEACARHLFRYLNHNGFTDLGAGFDSDEIPADAARTPSKLQQPPQRGVEIEAVPAPLRRHPRRMSQPSNPIRAPQRIAGDNR